MSRHQLIPAALREEFTEYSSLLRALRTSHTLDLPVHLATPYAKASDDESNDDINDEGRPPISSTLTAPTGSSIEAGYHIGSKRKRPESEPEPAHWKNRDQWTRWPILVKDVPPPDWSLQDEIGIIIKSILLPEQELSSPSPDEGSIDHDDNEDEDEDEDIKNEPSPDIDFNDSEDEKDTYIYQLAETMTPVIRNKLESLFALISAHTIARPDSMQNRIEPFDWRDLLNIMGSPAAGHLVDETLLRNVSSRMEQIFKTTPASSSNSIPAPSPSIAIHRHTLTETSRARLRGLLSKHTSSLFEQTLPPQDYVFLTSRQISARKKKTEKRRSRKRADIGEEGMEEGGGQDPGVAEVKGKGKAREGRVGELSERRAPSTRQHLNEKQDEYPDWETNNSL